MGQSGSHEALLLAVVLVSLVPGSPPRAHSKGHQSLHAWGRAGYEARREGEGMDRGEEDRVSTGGGEGREEKGDGGEGGEKKGTGGGKGKGVRMCDMKTSTHHGGCKTQMRVLLSTHTLQ